jgi:hypothetical protein
MFLMFFFRQKSRRCLLGGGTVGAGRGHDVEGSVTSIDGKINGSNG